MTRTFSKDEWSGLGDMPAPVLNREPVKVGSLAKSTVPGKMYHRPESQWAKSKKKPKRIDHSQKQTKKPRQQGNRPDKTFTVTRQWIHEYRRGTGGWKAKQLAAIGVNYPPKKGWISRVSGMRITEFQREKFEARGETLSKKNGLRMVYKLDDGREFSSGIYKAESREWHFPDGTVKPQGTVGVFARD